MTKIRYVQLPLVAAEESAAILAAISLLEKHGYSVKLLRGPNKRSKKGK